MLLHPVMLILFRMRGIIHRLATDPYDRKENQGARRKCQPSTQIIHDKQSAFDVTTYRLDRENEENNGCSCDR
jgi:hypothetical protein